MGIVVLLIFVSGVAISGWLGFLGLTKGELQFSKDTVLRGAAARAAGIVCLIVCAALIGFCIWLALVGLKR